MEHTGWLPIFAKLADRLSDHGLISIVTVEALPEDLAIRDWLMSCRVLGRGVESFLMNRVVEHARQLGLTRITAQYIPTPKNGMVKDFFQQFGFEKFAEGPKGESEWHLITTKYEPRPTFMKTVEEKSNAGDGSTTSHARSHRSLPYRLRSTRPRPPRCHDRRRR